MKKTDIFDRLNNTIGNHMEGRATDKDLINMAYEIDKYLLENPHPHDMKSNINEPYCSPHATNFKGKCLICGEQVFEIR